VSMDENSNVLCLTSDQCREFVEDNLDRFTGYNVHKDLPRCTVTTATTCSLAADLEFDHWTITAGQSQCADDDKKVVAGEAYDFSTLDIQEKVEIGLGKVMVTAVANLGFEYVATPHLPTSVEITGSGLSMAEDRIMIIDCSGSCGTNHATNAVNVTTDRFLWPYISPVYNWRDGPWHDRGEVIVQDTETHVGDYIYRKYPYSLCPGNNLPASLDSPLWDILKPYLCYYKCFVNAHTSGNEPTCNGFMTTFDDPQSKALCVTQTQALELCSSIDECHGIEESTEHFSVDNVDFRYYLNGIGCLSYLNTHDSTLESEDKYHFHWKYRQGFLVDPNNASARRRLDDHQETANGSCHPYSTTERLLFNGFRFNTGGKYKVCYCDSSQLAPGQYCNHPSRFSIQVGHLHSSGLQCLIEHPDLQRSTCEEQCYGGLKCTSE